MQSVTAWIAKHALDFEPVGIYAGAGIAVFLVMVAMGLLLMPGALRWLWRALRGYCRGR